MCVRQNILEQEFRLTTIFRHTLWSPTLMACFVCLFAKVSKTVRHWPLRLYIFWISRTRGIYISVLKKKFEILRWNQRNRTGAKSMRWRHKSQIRQKTGAKFTRWRQNDIKSHFKSVKMRRKKRSGSTLRCSSTEGYRKRRQREEVRNCFRHVGPFDFPLIIKNL